MSLVLEIITPEKVVYKNEIDEALIPTVNGQIGILPGHIGLVSKIVPGELVVKKGGNQDILAITGGFLEVNKDKVTILADYAIRAEDIEIAKVQEAQKRAEKLMEEKLTEEEFRVNEAEMLKAITQLRVASKIKRRSTPPRS